MQESSRLAFDNHPSTPPRSIAVSGVLFSLLFLSSLIMIRVSIPADPHDPGIWLSNRISKAWVEIALSLVPFTGISFLWFMGVLRNQIGELEDRFFATVFLGSGFLFVVLLFASTVIAQSLLEVFGESHDALQSSETYVLGRHVAYALLTSYSLRMAAVFMSVTSIIGLKTGALPRSLTRAGTVSAIVMLVFVSRFAWLSLLFPGWVLIVSIWILRKRYERRNVQHIK